MGLQCGYGLTRIINLWITSRLAVLTMNFEIRQLFPPQCSAEKVRCCSRRKFYSSLAETLCYHKTHPMRKLKLRQNVLSSCSVVLNKLTGKRWPMWDSEKKFCIFVRANYIRLTKHHENYYTEFSTWKWIKNVFCVVKTRKEDDKILF